jgi:hypothetical protein
VRIHPQSRIITHVEHAMTAFRSLRAALVVLAFFSASLVPTMATDNLAFTAEVFVPACGLAGTDFSTTWTSSSRPTLLLPQECANLMATLSFTPVR